jgi:hypothetical protein
VIATPSVFEVPSTEETREFTLVTRCVTGFELVERGLDSVADLAEPGGDRLAQRRIGLDILAGQTDLALDEQRGQSALDERVTNAVIRPLAPFLKVPAW